MDDALPDVAEGLLQLLRPSTRAALQAAIIDGVHPAITVYSYPVLVGISRFQPVSASRLEQEVGVDRTVISRRASALVHAGLVDHAESVDGRRRLLKLTAGGSALATQLDGRRQVMLGEALAGWSPADRRALGTSMLRFADSLRTRFG